MVYFVIFFRRLSKLAEKGLSRDALASLINEEEYHVVSSTGLLRNNTHLITQLPAAQKRFQTDRVLHLL